jgi:uncharacterized repeat protein (TIGR03803 family)
MRQKKFWFWVSGVLALLAMALMLPGQAVAASKYKVLHRFKSPAGGEFPDAGLILDAAGNLYGTTQNGGNMKGGSSKCPGYGCGVVFELIPNANGNWEESVLYRFKGGSDGAQPVGSLVLDGAGNLYGTTLFGGIDEQGTVFKLKPNSDGTWTESVLYRFRGGSDGASPYGGLIFDLGGNLYGTTWTGGVFNCTHGCGTVFKLEPKSDGSWTETVLYRFTDGTDAGVPIAGLVFDAAGNLYGATPQSGNPDCLAPVGCGAIFKLTPNSDGTWTESVLYRFSRRGGGGIKPSSALILDGAGNLYGTAEQGGDNNCPTVGGCGCGVVFELTPNGDGTWTETVLHRFKAGSDGANPLASLTFDEAGNLYGTAAGGGAYGYGVVFELMPTSTGWKERVLHAFAGNPAYAPLVGLTLDKAGTLYSTAALSALGTGCYGLVFEITP